VCIESTNYITVVNMCVDLENCLCEKSHTYIIPESVIANIMLGSLHNNYLYIYIVENNQHAMTVNTNCWRYCSLIPKMLSPNLSLE